MTTIPTAPSGSETWSQLTLFLLEPSTSEVSLMSIPPTSPDSPNAISSPGSADGPTPSPWPDGPTIDLFGRVVVPANPSPPQENKAVALTSDISGLRGFGSSASVALTQSLANRLRERLGSDGGIEYAQTWRRLVTPAGRRYWAHTASARRTSDSDCSGAQRLPLPNNQSCLVDTSDYSILSQWKWTLNSKGYVCRNTRQGKLLLHRLLMQAQPGQIVDHINRDRLDNRRRNLRLVSMSESNHNRALSNDGVTKPKGRNKWNVTLWIDGTFQWLGSFDTKDEAIAARQKRLVERGLVTTQTAQLAGWATPRVRDSDKGIRSPTAAWKEIRRKGPQNELGLAVALVSGPTAPGSPASTAKRGALNPAFPRWLQGYPTVWDDCAPSKMGL